MDKTLGPASISSPLPTMYCFISKSFYNCYLIPKQLILRVLLPIAMTKNAHGFVYCCTFFFSMTQWTQVYSFLGWALLGCAALDVSVIF